MILGNAGGLQEVTFFFFLTHPTPPLSSLTADVSGPLCACSHFNQTAHAQLIVWEIQDGGRLTGIDLDQKDLEEMFKKLKQKIAEESEGEQSPLRQQSREGQVQKICLVIRVNASLVKGQIVLSSRVLQLCSCR